jgi:hypothetical protein
MPKGDGQCAHERGEGGHHDRAEADEAGFDDRFRRALAVVALGSSAKVDHHDRVLLSRCR